jgi:PAS domain S-box-containing protein
MSEIKENGKDYSFQELEEMHHILINKSTDPIFSISSEGRYLYVNRAFTKETEKSVDQIIGKTIYDVFVRDEADKYFSALNCVFQSGEEKVVEVNVSGADCDKYFSTTITPIKDGQGKVRKVICSLKDISQLKQMEQELLESRKRIAKENDQMQRLLTYLRQNDTGGQEITSFVVEECVKISESEMGFFGFIDDELAMTAQVWCEQTMKMCAIDNKPVRFPLVSAGIWAESIRTKKLFVNNDYQKFDPHKKGYPKGHVPIQRYLSIPVIRENKVVAVLGLANKKQDYTEDDVVHLSLFIENVWVLFKKKEAEVALIRSEAYFHSLIENASDVIIILNDNGVIQYNSSSIENVLRYGQSELISRKIFDFIHPDDLAAVTDIFNFLKQEPGLTSSMELRFLDKAGSWRYLEVTGKNLLENDIVKGIIINSHDISSRKYAEIELEMSLQKLKKQHEQLKLAQLQLIESEKMAGLGTLVAGVAHEINNPTHYIYLSSKTLEKDIAKFKNDLLYLLSDNEKEIIFFIENAFTRFRHSMQYIIEGSNRIKMIVEDLRTFSRLDEAEKKEISISDALESTLRLVKTQYNNQVGFIINLKIQRNIECYPAKINQVFMNIIVNACQAICRKQAETNNNTPGKLKICAEDSEKELRISFEDNGSGMSEEVKARVFEPFFTTKMIGEGTGLGLSISYAIIQEHKGRIEIESQSGEGTTVTVIIPIN